jgi:phosphoribosylaminoimidazole-succinocarboxamide synthase
MLYEGKAKKVYKTDEEGYCIIDYKDDATAFNAQKKGTIRGKGSINNRMSALLFQALAKAGVPSHFVALLGEASQSVLFVEIVPLEVIVRNTAAGSLSARLGIPEGTPLSPTVVELSYKDDALGDPLINDSHALAMGLATAQELEEIKGLALKVDEELSKLFLAAGLKLIDFKLEFGRRDGKILLADEISPDTCRLWDAETNEKMDKDRFRRDMGGVEEAYQEVMRRLEGEAISGCL